MKKKLVVLIIAFLVLSICIYVYVYNSMKNDIKNQHTSGIKNTTEAFEQFDRFTSALLKNDLLEFKYYTESYTSLIVSISEWAPAFAKMAEMNELNYIDPNLKLQDSIVNMYLDIKELYFGIVDSKYFHKENSYSDSKLLRMQKNLREKMQGILINQS